jgi:hypothetical protein
LSRFDVFIADTPFSLRRHATGFAADVIYYCLS